MKRSFLAITLAGLAFTTLVEGQGGDANYGRPKRLNKMIELLAAGQPVYDVGVTGGGYEEGKKLAQTTNDLIQYEMEHGPFDPQRLREFMRGLVDGGPTKSGHRTPTVIVTLPFIGLDAASMISRGYDSNTFTFAVAMHQGGGGWVLQCSTSLT